MKGFSMFKKGKNSVGQKVQEPAPEPVKTAAQTEAEKVIARGERVSQLAGEAEMWRKFAESCVPFRYLAEHYYSYSDFAANHCARLSTRMDEDSAPLWRAFANQMAEERERRLKDVLGV